MTPAVSTSRLVQFNAKLDKKLEGVVSFAARRPDGTYGEDKSSGLKTAAKVAGVGALAAGGLYARGRAAAGAGAPHVGILPTIKGGAQALKGDAGLLAAKTGAAAAKAGAKVNQVGRNALASSLKAAKSAGQKLPFRKR